jgi:hypothetical protein
MYIVGLELMLLFSFTFLKYRVIIYVFYRAIVTPYKRIYSSLDSVIPYQLNPYTR